MNNWSELFEHTHSMLDYFGRPEKTDTSPARRRDDDDGEQAEKVNVCRIVRDTMKLVLRHDEFNGDALSEGYPPQFFPNTIFN